MAYSLTYSYDSTNQSYSVTGYSNITTSDKVVIPDKYDDGTNGEHTVTSIAATAFFNCSSLTSISIGNSVTSIGSYAFQNCSNLTSVAIPNSVTSIGSYAFYNCSSLTSVTIGNSVTSIDERAFSGCSSLTSVTIGNSVTSIGSSTFSGCSSLTSITIPNSVTSIGDGAFDACSSLVQLILFQSTPPTLGSYAIPANVQSIYVQQSSKTVYKTATNWTAFASKIVSDNIYLSFVRFNQKNKEYINGKVNELSAAANLENGTGDVLIQTTDSNQSFKVMTDGRAKVYGAPQDPTDVVRKQDLDKPYELIEEITLTEDTNIINRTDYNFKELYIRVDVPQYTDTHNILFIINGGSVINCRDVINKNFNAISAIYASIKGNLLFLGYTQNTNNESNALEYKQGVPYVNASKINELTLNQDAGNVIPAGTVIQIYGR